MKDRQCHSGEFPVDREAPGHVLLQASSDEQLPLSVTEAGPALTDLFPQAGRASTRVTLPRALSW